MTEKEFLDYMRTHNAFRENQISEGIIIFKNSYLKYYSINITIGSGKIIVPGEGTYKLSNCEIIDNELYFIERKKLVNNF